MAKARTGRSAGRGEATSRKALSRPVPGVDQLRMPFTGMPPSDPQNNETAKAANSFDALFGRIGYAAGPAPSRYSTYPADGISAEMVKTVIRQADLGYPRLQSEMYEQVIERDAHLRGVSKARIYEVSGKPWRMKPHDETPLADAVAKFCKGAIEEIEGFDSDIEDLLAAEANAYSASEILWHFDDLRIPDQSGNWRNANVLVPRSLDWVHGKHFEFDQVTDEPYLWISGARIRLPESKFIFHAASGTGVIARRGYMRPCLTLHAAKAWTLRDWLLYESLFSIPQITGSYPGEGPGSEEYDTQRETYQEIMRAWGKGIPAIVPDDFKMTITTAQNGGTASGVHGAILGFCNQEISKLVQGETLTTEIGNVGAKAASETHADVRHAFIRADARKLERTLRQDLLRPIVERNLEVLANILGASPRDILRVIPHIYWRIDRETSATERVGNLIALANAGVPIGLDQVYDECGIDPPREGAALMRGNPIQISKGAAATGSQEASERGVVVPDNSSTDSPANGDEKPSDKVTN